MAHAQSLRRQRWLWWLWAACGLIFITTAAQAASGQFRGWEVSWLLKVYNLPIVWRPAFIFFTVGGTIWAAGLVAIIVTLKRHYFISARVIIMSLIAYLTAELAKFMVQRPRPFYTLPTINPRVYEPDKWGFPSGHTTLAALLASVLWPYANRWQRIGLGVGVGLVGISRLYLGVHAPLDVIGGLALGLMLGLLPYLWRNQLYRRSDGRRLKKAHN